MYYYILTVTTNSMFEENYRYTVMFYILITTASPLKLVTYLSFTYTFIL